MVDMAPDISTAIKDILQKGSSVNLFSAGRAIVSEVHFPWQYGSSPSEEEQPVRALFEEGLIEQKYALQTKISFPASIRLC